MKKTGIILVAALAVLLLAFFWVRRDYLLPLEGNVAGSTFAYNEQRRPRSQKHYSDRRTESEIETAKLSSAEKAKITEWKCKLNAGPDTYKRYYFRRRQCHDLKCRCPKGWATTGCNVFHGEKYRNKECRRDRLQKGIDETSGGSCVGDHQCEKGRYCENGRCKFRLEGDECKMDRHCPLVMICKDNRCVLPGKNQKIVSYWRQK